MSIKKNSHSHSNDDGPRSRGTIKINKGHFSDSTIKKSSSSKNSSTNKRNEK